MCTHAAEGMFSCHLVLSSWLSFLSPRLDGGMTETGTLQRSEWSYYRRPFIFSASLSVKTRILSYQANSIRIKAFIWHITDLACCTDRILWQKQVRRKWFILACSSRGEKFITGTGHGSRSLRLAQQSGSSDHISFTIRNREGLGRWGQP